MQQLANFTRCIFNTLNKLLRAIGISKKQIYRGNIIVGDLKKRHDISQQANVLVEAKELGRKLV